MKYEYFFTPWREGDWAWRLFYIFLMAAAVAGTTGIIAWAWQSVRVLVAG